MAVCNGAGLPGKLGLKGGTILIFSPEISKKFIENSSPCISMKRSEEKGKVVLVALCGGWSVYQGMALVVSVAEDWRFYGGVAPTEFFGLLSV